VTVSDKKLQHQSADTVDYYLADVVTAQDYYPFGMIQPGRQYSNGSYRYGFNGKEKSDEIEGNGVDYDYGMRIYDSRVGRFLSEDPLTRSYPYYSPYQFAGNKPTFKIDLDGKEEAAPLDLRKPGDVGAYITITTVMDIRNAITNTGLRMSPFLQTLTTMKLLENSGITDKRMQLELSDYYVARMVTISEYKGDNLYDMTPIYETRREWALTPKNSLGKEFLQASLDVLAISSVVPAKGSSLLLFEQGTQVVGLNQLKKAFSILFNVRRMSSAGVNNGLAGVHSLEDVMEAGMAFVGKNAKKVYAESGRFIGYESTDGLRRFRPSAFKKTLGKFQANFEQRTSTDVKWDNDAGQTSRSNMHVDTDKGFDYNAERKPPTSASENK